MFALMHNLSASAPFYACARISSKLPCQFMRGINCVHIKEMHEMYKEIVRI